MQMRRRPVRRFEDVFVAGGFGEVFALAGNGHFEEAGEDRGEHREEGGGGDHDEVNGSDPSPATPPKLAPTGAPVRK